MSFKNQLRRRKGSFTVEAGLQRRICWVGEMRLQVETARLLTPLAKPEGRGGPSEAAAGVLLAFKFV